MSEDDIERIMKHPSAMIGSDGLPMDEHPHPRLWGTFPRVIRRYALEKCLFSVEEAIRKMTSMPARRFGPALSREFEARQLRGFSGLRSCNDLRSCDPMNGRKQHAAGIRYVFVNGRLSWDGGMVGNRGNGRLIRRNDGVE